MKNVFTKVEPLVNPINQSYCYEAALKKLNLEFYTLVRTFHFLDIVLKVE